MDEQNEARKLAGGLGTFSIDVILMILVVSFVSGCTTQEPAVTVGEVLLFAVAGVIVLAFVPFLFVSVVPSEEPSSIRGCLFLLMNVLFCILAVLFLWIGLRL